MTVEQPKPRQLLRPITTGADSAMNQSQFLATTCNWLEAREESRVHRPNAKINYSFIFVLISLTSLVSMRKIQKNFHTKMRLVSLISIHIKE